MFIRIVLVGVVAHFSLLVVSCAASRAASERPVVLFESFSSS